MRGYETVSHDEPSTYVGCESGARHELPRSGDYVLAASELVLVIRDCRERYTVSHPSTLHYLSKLAHAWCCSGFLGIAETLIFQVLRFQHATYALGDRPIQAHPDYESPGAKSIGTTVRITEKELIMKILGEIQVESRLSEILGQFRVVVASQEQDHTNLIENLVKDIRSAGLDVGGLAEIKGIWQPKSGGQTVEQTNLRTTRIRRDLPNSSSTHISHMHWR